MAKPSLSEIGKRVAQLETRLNKTAVTKGASIMTDVEFAPNTYFLRRPSGIMPLDIHTGGGLPAGGLTYLSGPDSSGKTFLLYKYLAMNQRLHGSRSVVALGVSEAAPDHFFMRKCGIHVRIPEVMIEERSEARKQLCLPPFAKEEIQWFRQPTVGAFKILRGAYGEELLGGLLSCFSENCFDIIGLDSVSAILPEADVDKDLDERGQRAAAATVLTKFFQHYLNGTTGYYGLNPTTVIFTAQVRANSKKAEAPAAMQRYLSDYAPQGAWAAKHGKLLDILLRPGEKAKENVPVSALPSFGEMAKQAEERKRKEQVGKVMRYEVLKGKAGIHEGIVGEFDFRFSTASDYRVSTKLTDDLSMVVLAGMQRGLVLEHGDGLVTVFDPSKKGPDSKQGVPFAGMQDLKGLPGLLQKLDSDFELELTLRRAILAASGIECAYR